MNETVRRGSLPALIMNILAPGAGLIYLHRPLRGILCALIIMLVFAGERFLHTLADLNGMLISLGLILTVWLFALISGIFLAGKGLEKEEALNDLGVWIVFFMLIQGVSLSMLDSLPYRSITVEEVRNEDTVIRHHIAVYTAPKNLERKTIGQERLLPGDTVVVTRHGDHYLTRMWGMPGDVLENKDDKLYRNGQPVWEGTVILPNNSDFWVVPTDVVFVWGCSPGEDAEENGAVHNYSVFGKPLYTYWSDDRNVIGTLPCLVGD